MCKYINGFEIGLNLLKSLESEISHFKKTNDENKNELTLHLLNLTKISLSLCSFYLLGFISPKSLDSKLFLNLPRYKIIADNIINLKILDTHLNIINSKRPEEILFSKEYKDYSKDDVARIAYICGQLSIKKLYLKNEKVE